MKTAGGRTAVSYIGESRGGIDKSIYFVVRNVHRNTALSNSMAHGCHAFTQSCIHCTYIHGVHFFYNNISFEPRLYQGGSESFPLTGQPAASALAMPFLLCRMKYWLPALSVNHRPMPRAPLNILRMTPNTTASKGLTSANVCVPKKVTGIAGTEGEGARMKTNFARSFALLVELPLNALPNQKTGGGYSDVSLAFDKAWGDCV